MAAQKVMIEQMINAAEAAHLTPVGLDLVPFAIVRSVGSLDGMGLEAGDTGDEAVVDIGADVTSICVHAWGVPRFVRILPSGGRDITSAVARSMGVSDEEAESMKRAVAGGGRSGDQVSTVTASRSSSFADEIRSSLEFYLTQMPGAKMGRVLVTGGGSKLPGLMQLLAERLPSPVAAGHAFGRVRNSLDMPAGSAPRRNSEPRLPWGWRSRGCEDDAGQSSSNWRTREAEDASRHGGRRRRCGRRHDDPAARLRAPGGAPRVGQSPAHRAGVDQPGLPEQDPSPAAVR